MSSLTVRIPDSLHKGLRDISQKEGVSINQFIAIAVAEKMSALNTFDTINARKQRGSEKALFDVLSKVQSREPLPGDQIN